MTKVDVQEAEASLLELVNKALNGEEVILTRQGQPLVRLEPVTSTSGRLPVGLHATELSDEAAAESMRPLSDEDLGFWQDSDRRLIAISDKLRQNFRFLIFDFRLPLD